MTKQAIIDRLTTAFEVGGTYAFEKALHRISQRYSIYTLSDYPFDRFEVVRFSLGEGDRIITTTLLQTDSLEESINCFADCASSI